MKILKKLVVFCLAGAMSLSMIACANNSGNNSTIVDDNTQKVEVTMDMIATTLKNTFGDYYLPGMPLDQESFNMMTGLTSDMYSEFFAEVPMMMTHVDKLFVVKTDNVEAVKAVFENYKTMQIEDAMQYPMNLTKLENAVVAVHGDYVFYYMLGGYTDSFMDDEVEQKGVEMEYYAEQNKKANDALVALFTDGTIPEPTSSMLDVVE